MISGIPESSSTCIMQSDSSEHMAAMRWLDERGVGVGEDVAQVMQMWQIFQKAMQVKEGITYARAHIPV